jgi:hypothetical protein
MRVGRACITKQNPILSSTLGVNAAGIWDESYRSYPGRSHGRVETEYETRSKTCHEKSAEAIVRGDDLSGEGLNFKV